MKEIKKRKRRRLPRKLTKMFLSGTGYPPVALFGGTIGFTLPVSIFVLLSAGTSFCSSFFLLVQPVVIVSEKAATSRANNNDFDLVGFMSS